MLTTEKHAARARAQADGHAIERAITRVYRSILEAHPGATLVDGGAHHGHHTFRMADLPTAGCIIAVEANPQTFGELAGLVAAHPNGKKIKLHQGALQDDEAVDWVTFRMSPTHPGRSGINPVLIHAPGTEFDLPISVAATSVDQVTRDAPTRVAFIKLDLEGGEFAALRGSRTCLKRDRPVVVFENGEDAPSMNGYSPEDLLGFFRQNGYEPRTVFGETMTAANIGDFWYAWAVPNEHSSVRATIAEAVGQELEWWP